MRIREWVEGEGMGCTMQSEEKENGKSKTNMQITKKISQGVNEVLQSGRNA